MPKYDFAKFLRSPLSNLKYILDDILATVHIFFLVLGFVRGKFILLKLRFHTEEFVRLLIPHSIKFIMHPLNRHNPNIYFFHWIVCNDSQVFP